MKIKLRYSFKNLKDMHDFCAVLERKQGTKVQKTIHKFEKKAEVDFIEITETKAPKIKKGVGYILTLNDVEIPNKAVNLKPSLDELLTLSGIREITSKNAEIKVNTKKVTMQLGSSLPEKWVNEKVRKEVNNIKTTKQVTDFTEIMANKLKEIRYEKEERARELKRKLQDIKKLYSQLNIIKNLETKIKSTKETLILLSKFLKDAIKKHKEGEEPYTSIEEPSEVEGLYIERYGPKGLKKIAIETQNIEKTKKRIEKLKGEIQVMEKKLKETKSETKRLIEKIFTKKQFRQDRKSLLNQVNSLKKELEEEEKDLKKLMGDIKENVGPVGKIEPEECEIETRKGPRM